jgi:hypothetical protein
VTRIAARKTSLVAETSAVYRGRALVVELTPHFVFLRGKGTRQTVSVPWLAVHELGLKLQARSVARERTVRVRPRFRK